LALWQQLGQLGEQRERKQVPTGYSKAGQEWVNSAALLARMNFGIALTANRIPCVKVDAARCGDGEDPSSIAKALLLRDLSHEARAAIGTALDSPTGAVLQTPSDNVLSEPPAANGGPKRRGLPVSGLLPARPVPKPLIIAGLLLGSPDFQKR